ncbi:hypothetical protein GCM10009862_15620 [Microbacterium binotii]|uniref:Uncharacterized protein n=1 Tax=Microbacterium binotii TaxID=462710 RepID=A0ABN3PB70_9MICO
MFGTSPIVAPHIAWCITPAYPVSVSERHVGDVLSGVDPELVARARAAAEARGEDFAAVVARILAQYAETPPPTSG